VTGSDARAARPTASGIQRMAEVTSLGCAQFNSGKTAAQVPRVPAVRSGAERRQALLSLWDEGQMFDGKSDRSSEVQGLHDQAGGVQAVQSNEEVLVVLMRNSGANEASLPECEPLLDSVVVWIQQSGGCPETTKPANSGGLVCLLCAYCDFSRPN